MTYKLIILYIIIIIMLVFLKPSFLYDVERQQYKEFGTGENQTIYTLPVVAIVTAIIFAVIAMSFKIKSAQNNQSSNQIGGKEINYKFIPVPVYYQQPMVQVPFSQMNPNLTRELSQQFNQPMHISSPLLQPQQAQGIITQPINVTQSGGQYMVTPEMFLNMF